MTQKTLSWLKAEVLSFMMQDTRGAPFRQREEPRGEVLPLRRRPRGLTMRFETSPKEPSTVRTVILGDVHLGSPLCRAEPLRALLEELPFDRLVLNGDIFDDLNFRRLSAPHWAVLELVRRRAENGEVVWIRGNHDGPAEVLRHLLGVPVEPEYSFPYRGRTVYVTHGDQFDRFQASARRMRRLRDLRDLFHGFAIWFDVPRKAALQWLQRSNGVYARAVDQVKRRAFARARELGASYVVTGHTHRRETETRGGITYLNPSSWLTAYPAFILFDDCESEPRLVVLDARLRHQRRRRRRGGVPFTVAKG